MKRFFTETQEILFFVDGNNCFYYAGRIDQQVKIQGHRVELGEIEKHARDITNSENTIAVAHINEFGNYQIHLFTENEEIKYDDLVQGLKSKLPYYMIPSNITYLKKLPLNANGKIDRVALKKMVE
ncbi:MAG: hypothetical protein R2764_14300 [Bacteroidales bacterium]